jgi:flagellar biosynthesis/type III secretory pathway protein FliH
VPHLADCEVVDDAAVSPGGCRVYYGQGEVVGDLDRQLDRVVNDLLPDPAATGGVA